MRAGVFVRSYICALRMLSPSVYIFRIFSLFTLSIAASTHPSVSIVVVDLFLFSFLSRIHFFLSFSFPFTNLYTFPFTHQMNAVSV